MPGTRSDVDAGAATFADALAELKQSGSMLLVTGRGHAAASDACDRLMGEASTDPRRRLFVRTNGESHVPTANAGLGSTRSVSYQTQARSTASVDAGADATVPKRPVDGSLTDLHDAIVAELDAFETGAGGFEPAEVRICLDSGVALLSDHGDEAVFRFLHALAGTVRESRAMCHVHLPVAFDDETVQTLVPLFDAVVEVRTDGRQRWHLRDPDFTTDWLDL